jgi:hypothetical protein
MYRRFLFLIFLFFIGCKCNNQSEAQKTWASSHAYLSIAPQLNEVVGTYVLTSQSVTENGLLALEGRPCQLALFADGSFTLTNYPNWMTVSKTQQITEFGSTAGTFTIDEIGLANGKPLWGIRFRSKPDLQFPEPGFVGTAAPYRLVSVYGDADEGREMLFEMRTKNE